MDGTTALAALGLEPDATEHDIKLAFRSLAKSAHPDASGDAAGFVALRAAYEQALASALVRPAPEPANHDGRWFRASPARRRIDLVDSAPPRRTAPTARGAADERAFAALLRRELAQTGQAA